MASLLAKGAYPFVVFSDKTTLLALAVKKGHYECLELLMRHIPNRRDFIVKIAQKIQSNPLMSEYFQIYLNILKKIDEEDYPHALIAYENTISQEQEHKTSSIISQTHSPKVESLLRRNKKLFDECKKDPHLFVLQNAIIKIEKDDKPFAAPEVKSVRKPIPSSNPASPPRTQSFLSRIFCCFFSRRSNQVNVSEATRNALYCK